MITVLNFVVIGFLVGLQGSVDSNSTVGKFLSKSQTCRLLRMGRHGNEVTTRQQSFGFSLLSSVQKIANITFTESFVHVQSEHYTSDTQHKWVWMSVGKYIWNELP